MSDRKFQSNRSIPIALFLLMAMLMALLLYFLPKEQLYLGIILLFFAGFFCFGPPSLLFALCPDLLGTRYASTGVGILDSFAYVFAAVGQVIVGLLITQTGSVNIVFLIIAIACFCGAITGALIRR